MIPPCLLHVIWRARAKPPLGDARAASHMFGVRMASHVRVFSKLGHIRVAAYIKYLRVRGNEGEGGGKREIKWDVYIKETKGRTGREIF